MANRLRTSGGVLITKVAGVAAMLLLGAACGMSSTSSSNVVKVDGKVNNHGTKTATSSSSLELEQDDFYFSPTFIKVRPGQSLTISLRNEGKVKHNLTIDAAHVDQTVQPDGQATVNITVPSSGAILFYCKFHKDIGMKGALYFQAGQTAKEDESGSSGGSSGSGSSPSSGSSSGSGSGSGSGY